MKRPVIVTAVLAVVTAAPAVYGQQDDWDGTVEDEPPRRRSDFTFGMKIGALTGRVVGYPNEARAIGDPELQADTGPAIGQNLALWFGVTMSDWLTFGLGIGAYDYVGNGLRARGGGLIFRIETFPLFYQGGAFEDLGLYGDFGAGQMLVKDRGDQIKQQVADGGSISIASLGILWEGLEFLRFSAGPYAEYQHLFSQSLTGNGALFGFRIAWYGGQPKVTSKPKRAPERAPSPEREPPPDYVDVEDEDEEVKEYPYHPSVAP